MKMHFKLSSAKWRPFCSGGYEIDLIDAVPYPKITANTKRIFKFVIRLILLNNLARQSVDVFNLISKKLTTLFARHQHSVND